MSTTVVLLVMFATSIWIYWDATTHRIGKIPGPAAVTNNSAGAWAVATLLLWIVVLPFYLWKRAELIERAKANPVDTKNRGGKLGLLVVLGGVAIYFVFFGPGTSLGIPNCSDSRTLGLVQQIINNRFRETLGVSATVQLSGITTVGQTGGYTCEAIGDLPFGDGSSATGRRIQYTSRATDDSRHMVEVALR